MDEKGIRMNENGCTFDLIWYDLFTESSDIQYANVVRGRAKWNTLIDICYNAIEKATVQRFSQRIASIIGFIDFQWNPVWNIEIENKNSP